MATDLEEIEFLIQQGYTPREVMEEKFSYRRYEKQIKTCPYEKQSNRTDMRRVFEEIEHINPEARYSIWHALEKEGKLISINDK